MNKLPRLVLARKVFFSSAISYFCLEQGKERNQCRPRRPQGYGYNFVLEIRVQGRRDPVTGLVVNLSDLDKNLQALVKTLDHHHLAFEVEAFKNKVPSLENVAEYCFTELKKKLGSQLAGVRLSQGNDDWLDIN